MAEKGDYRQLCATSPARYPCPQNSRAKEIPGRGRSSDSGISILSPKMQPGIQRCLRKAQNIWLFFFQCAKNCFVLNKGKRYIRLKIPSHHSQKADGGGTSQLPCPAPLSRGQTSHLRVLTRRSGGGSSLCTAGQAH